MSDWSGARVVDSVEDLCSSITREALRFIWCTTGRNRRVLECEVQDSASDREIRFVTHSLVNQDAFKSANALRNDMRQLLEAEREQIEGVLAESVMSPERPLCVLVISKERLLVPGGTDSLVRLPDWIPDLGGREINIAIEDLEAVAGASLDCEEARIEDMSRRLYELEGRLQARWKRTVVENPNLGEKLFELLRDKESSSQSLLDACAANLKAVTDHGRYRPSAGREASVLGRLLRVASSRSADQIPEKGKVLCEALAIPTDEPERLPRPLVALLIRSTLPQTDVAAVAGDAILRTIHAASMFVTSAHHADRYPKYLVAVLETTSHDIRVQLDRINRLLAE